MKLNAKQKSVLETISNCSFKYLKFFNQLNDPSQDIATVGNKSYQVAQLFNTAVLSNSEFRHAAFGFATLGSAHHAFKEHNKFYPTIEKVLTQCEKGEITRSSAHEQLMKLIVSGSFPQDMEMEFETAFNFMVAFDPELNEVDYSENLQPTYLDSVVRQDLVHKPKAIKQAFARSCKLIREDTLEVAGAGKHESYGDLSFKEEWLKGIKLVFASDYSVQAIGDYSGLTDSQGRNLHTYSNMSCIFMVQIDSFKGCSFLGFSTFNNRIIIKTAPGLMGEVLVGGSAGVIPNEVQLSTTLIKAGHEDPFLTKMQVADQFVKLGFGLTRQQVIEAAKWIVDLHDSIDNPVDTEGAFDGQKLAFVQYRHYVPNIQLRDKKQLTFYTVPHYPTEEQLLFTGESVAEMCGVGKIRKLHSLKELDKPNFAGQIVVYDEASPELTVMTNLDEHQAPAGLITIGGTPLSHLPVNWSDFRPFVVGGQPKNKYEDGQDCTILLDRVYRGVHSYDTMPVDLTLLPDLGKGTKAKIVDARVAQVEKNSALPHSGYALVRQEALQQATVIDGASIPPLLSCLYPNRVQNTDLLKQIEKFTKGFKSPIDAYNFHIAGSLIPYAEDCRNRDATVSFRAYGGRIDEDNPFISGLPRQDNPMIGFTGAFAYINGVFTDTEECWGEAIFRSYCAIFVRLYDLGFTNVEFFIPNISSPAELEMLGLIMSDYGLFLDRQQRKSKPFTLKVMLETAAAFIYAREFYDMGVDKFSGGLNDTRQGVDFFDRGLKTPYKTRGILESKPYITLHDMMFDSLKGTSATYETCGVPTLGFMSYLVEKGAHAIGLAPGKAFVEGYRRIYDTKVKLGLL
jgi:phosphoenolpyruvate synthase/pyruvate phosphate dikinase